MNEIYKIYTNQSSLKIKLNMGIICTNAQSAKIKYKKPSGILGEWIAQFESYTDGIIFYNFGTALEEGNWEIWGYVVQQDGRTSISEPAYFTVAPEGQ